MKKLELKTVDIKKRLKLALYGKSGTGKTMAAISMPKPYIIDTENAIKYKQYIDKVKERDGYIYQTSNFKEILEKVRELLYTKHDFKTLVIDSISVPYSIVSNDFAGNPSDDLNAFNKNTSFGANTKKADIVFYPLLDLIGKLDMNVILTCHLKDKYTTTVDKYGKSISEVSGNTYDTYKKLDYFCDLLLELYQKDGSDKRIAKIMKSRIGSFKQGSSFEFSFDSIAEIYGREYISDSDKDNIKKIKSLGIELLEKGSEPIELITPEVEKELNNLLIDLHIDDNKINEMLKNANAESISDMDLEYSLKCVNALKNKYKNKLNSLYGSDAKDNINNDINM